MYPPANEFKLPHLVPQRHLSYYAQSPENWREEDCRSQYYSEFCYSICITISAPPTGFSEFCNRVYSSITLIYVLVCFPQRDLVYTSHDLDFFSHVLRYWHTRCLPPTTRGTLTVMGLIPIQDVMNYLQYYSLPIGTALLTPVIKLVVSLKEIYGTPAMKADWGNRNEGVRSEGRSRCVVK